MVITTISGPIRLRLSGQDLPIGINTFYTKYKKKKKKIGYDQLTQQLSLK